jgi:hypothetical protein
LAIYGPASSLHYIGMQEVFEVKEGLITGDSLSPLFATMVYSDCCKKTRELFLNTDVFAYFDDITPVSRGEEAWAAFDCMKESLAEEGLQLHPSKMEAYFNDLTDYHRGEAAKRGVSCTEEGLEILGCPVGSVRSSFARSSGSRSRGCWSFWTASPKWTRLEDKSPNGLLPKPFTTCYGTALCTCSAT